ncbi:MerR family transcriptional regulator [Paenibacillus albicereus]|uniref:MerR family transcriptional regulator n=1 Tax=Paenibacillus albicereus TaxID=2726185 RepID=A0A6H2H0Y7_9BACL|nr:MerR family transcriptional regulator [Paenibacillus albicereus]QJC53354.1 MerR family transcriptional regulator [Paenibacillus albicereus]
MLGVSEMAEAGGVTVKTLHYYHRIGLLPPAEVSEAGYRFYGPEEMLRLRHILFYRELEFTLEQIKQLLDQEPNTLCLLEDQHGRTVERIDRWKRMLRTLEGAIQAARKGEEIKMSVDQFEGFKDEEQWKEAMRQQREYVQEQYGHDLGTELPLDVGSLNEQAEESAQFTETLADLLRSGERHDGEAATGAVRQHILFMQAHGHAVTPQSFVEQSVFFREDPFHRQLLEGKQAGLSYYLAAAAEAVAKPSE